MRIFIAGATGALGRPLARRLVQGGHEVVGLTRSASRAADLEAAGVRAVMGDALDAERMREVIVASAPEVIVHALTDLPAAGPRSLRDLRATNRLRLDGTRNLIAGGRAAGTRRIVAESMILIYGDCGDRLAKESDPIALDVPARAEKDVAHPRHLSQRVAAGLAEPLQALLGLEAQVRDGGLEGVALRYGLFYGPATSSDAWAHQLRQRRLALPRSPRSRMSWIHVEDAAAATIAAIERAPAGSVYNVVDDEPAGIPTVVDEIARVTGAKPPWPAPLSIARLVAPYAAAVLSARVSADYTCIREDLGWTPAYPSYREGLAANVAPLPARRGANRAT